MTLALAPLVAGGCTARFTTFLVKEWDEEEEALDEEGVKLTWWSIVALNDPSLPRFS